MGKYFYGRQFIYSEKHMVGPAVNQRCGECIARCPGKAIEFTSLR